MNGNTVDLEDNPLFVKWAAKHPEMKNQSFFKYYLAHSEEVNAEFEALEQRG